MNVLVHCELLPGDHAPKHHELRIGHHVLIAGCDQRRVLEILRIKSHEQHKRQQTAPLTTGATARGEPS